MRAPTNSSMSSAGCGTAGTTARSSPTRPPAATSMPSKVRPLNHQGRFFKVRGPLNMARCPQGHPVIIQAGGSPSGLELAARTADVVFSVVQELAPPRPPMPTSRDAWPSTAATPDELAVLPGVMPIVGDSDAEAREKLAKLQSWITPTNATTLVASRIGYDVSGHPLDGPVPAAAAGAEQPDVRQRPLRDGAAREHDVARSLQPDRGGARPLGALRHARSASPTRWRNGSSSARPTGSTSCRPISRGLQRFRRSRRAGTAAPRPVPPRVRGHDPARPFRARARTAAPGTSLL